MKLQSAAISGALAVAGLVAVYVTWQRPDHDTGSDVVVADLARSDVLSVRYDDPRRTIDILRQPDGYWVRQTEKTPPPPPAAAMPVKPSVDGGTTVAAKASVSVSASTGSASATASTTPPPAPPRPHLYRANDSAERLLQRFAPFTAVRDLGVLPKDKLKELGFEGTERELQLATTRGLKRYKVASDNLGSSPYVQSVDDGRVYVVKSPVISDLEFASSRLVDRRLHTFRDDEFDAVTVHSGADGRTLKKTGEKLADDAQAAPDEYATNWHEKLWRMLGVDVLGKGEQPAAGTPMVKVRVDYLKGARPIGFIELATAGSDVFARTEHTAGWVRLHSGASQLLTEVDKVVQPKG